jgi:hypothetical protein
VNKSVLDERYLLFHSQRNIMFLTTPAVLQIKKRHKCTHPGSTNADTSLMRWPGDPNPRKRKPVSPIKETMGEGLVDQKNVMPLLHLVYDLQDSMAHEVWQLHIEDAQDSNLLYGDKDWTGYNGVTDADDMFLPPNGTLSRLSNPFHQC